MCVSQEEVKDKILYLIKKYIDTYGPDYYIDYKIDEYGLPVFTVKPF